jgi:hypothetical protein
MAFSFLLAQFYHAVLAVHKQIATKRSAVVFVGNPTGWQVRSNLAMLLPYERSLRGLAGAGLIVATQHLASRKG